MAYTQAALLKTLLPRVTACPGCPTVGAYECAVASGRVPYRAGMLPYHWQALRFNASFAMGFVAHGSSLALSSGAADRESSAPLSALTRIPMGSVTKVSQY